MNAPIAAKHVMQQVSGTLLHAGYQYDDGLVLDLYGYKDEDGHQVESIAVAGTTVEIVQLFRPRQMTNMGHWLDLKDGSAAQRVWAERYKQHAADYK